MRSYRIADLKDNETGLHIIERTHVVRRRQSDNSAVWEHADKRYELLCDYADADQYAPELLDSARTALTRAQVAAANRRERKLVPALALRATVDADLARARSEEAVANARLQQRRQEIGELQRTLGEGATR